MFMCFCFGVEYVCFGAERGSEVLMCMFLFQYKRNQTKRPIHQQESEESDNERS